MIPFPKIFNRGFYEYGEKNGISNYLIYSNLVLPRGHGLLLAQCTRLLTNGKKYFISITVFGTSKFETPVFLRKDILKYIAVHNGS